MATQRYRITYRDPDTNELTHHEEDFDASGSITAHEWAKDRGYALANKGWYELESVD